MIDTKYWDAIGDLVIEHGTYFDKTSIIMIRGDNAELQENNAQLNFKIKELEEDKTVLARALAKALATNIDLEDEVESLKNSMLESSR